MNVNVIFIGCLLELSECSLQQWMRSVNIVTLTTICLLHHRVFERRSQISAELNFDAYKTLHQMMKYIRLTPVTVPNYYNYLHKLLLDLTNTFTGLFPADKCSLVNDHYTDNVMQYIISLLVCLLVLVI